MKKTSTFQNGLIWFGAGVSLAEILTGTYFAPLGMARGFAAVVIGHVIGCVMMLLAKPFLFCLAADIQKSMADKYRVRRIIR